MADIIDVATYGRNSDPSQTTSQAIQGDLFQNFIDADDGFKRLFVGKAGRIVENYKDYGKSASKKKGKRLDFDRMLADIASGKQKIILVANTSRFSRLHAADTINFLTTFRDNDAYLVSIEDRKIIGIDEIGDLITTIMKFNSDHEYARSLSANILRGTIHAIKNDATSHVSLIPYGMAKLVITDTGEERKYARTNNMRLPETWKGYLIAGDEIEVEIVKWIFDTYLAADISLCEIARQLNNHKNPKVRLGYSGKGWERCRIKTILKNRHYRGQEFIGVSHQGEHYRAVDGRAVATKQAKELKPLIVQGKYPPVVDPEIFEKAQQKLRRKKGSKPKTMTTDGYCLTSSLICGHCGYAMTTVGKGKFACKSGRIGKTACKQWAIHEGDVLPWLVNRIDKEIIKKLQDKPELPSDTDAEKVRQQIATIDSKMQIITNQVTNADTTIETCRNLTTALNTLGDQKERLQSRLHDDNYHQQLEDAHDQWEELVKPYLVTLKTDDIGEGNPVVTQLGLQDDCDRLFNFVDAKPSKVRELLQSMETKVTCFFNPKQPSSRATGKRQHYHLDHGKVSIALNGIASRLQERDIRQPVHPANRPTAPRRARRSVSG